MVSNIIRFGNYFLKILAVSVIILILVSSFTPIALNAMSLPDFLKPTCNGNSCPFYFLAPINFPGFNIQGGVMDVGGAGASNYLKGLYTFGIAIASALALIVIVIGGVQYASTDAINGKSDGKAKIYAALTGLVLALLSYTLLNTINPYLVSNSFNPQTIVVAPGIGNGGVNPDGGAVTPVPEGPGNGEGDPNRTPADPQSLNGLTADGAYNQTMNNELGVANENISYSVTRDGVSWVAGKSSWFGGPNDTGVTPTETGSISGRNLRSVDPNELFLAMRFDYTKLNRDQLRNAEFEVYSPTTGRTISGVKAEDWGPHPRTGRSVDVSRGVYTQLGLNPDSATDEVLHVRIKSN